MARLNILFNSFFSSLPRDRSNFSWTYSTLLKLSVKFSEKYFYYLWSRKVETRWTVLLSVVTLIISFISKMAKIGQLAYRYALPEDWVGEIWSMDLRIGLDLGKWWIKLGTEICSYFIKGFNISFPPAKILHSSGVNKMSVLSMAFSVSFTASLKPKDFGSLGTLSYID